MSEMLWAQATPHSDGHSRAWHRVTAMRVVENYDGHRLARIARTLCGNEFVVWIAPTTEPPDDEALCINCQCIVEVES